MRSRAAAVTLTEAGFGDVYSMEGGINAWKGWVAEGAPQSGMAYFSAASKPEALIALAWYLEDGSQKFYSEVVKMLEDQQAKDLFKMLSQAEEEHKGSLRKLYKELSGVTSEEGFPGSILSPEGEGDVMEGGIRVSDALKWAKGKKVEEILELSISSETNAYDLYLKLKRQMKDQRSAKVFEVLSKEEKEHLERLSSLFQKRISNPN